MMMALSPVRRFASFLALAIALGLCGLPSAQAQAVKGAAVPPDHPFPKHMKSPSFDGGTDWLNTAGPLDVKDLRGKFVILDFWTYCCINCMHILPELKKLEHAYPNNLVVIGVHSAKFEEEKETKNIREAILRYEIEHPVVNDANHKIWNAFGVDSWPSLRVIDPEGNLVAGNGGEIEFEALDAFMKRALPYYRKKGVLDETPLRFDQEQYTGKTPLRFPGKILADEQGNRLFISDSNHNRIVITTLDGKLLDVIGSGAIGRIDGDYAKASFDHPQGCALRGETLYVADTENHLLRKVDLEKKTVTTISGTGKQRREQYWPGLDPARRDANGEPIIPKRWVDRAKGTALNSPWALWIHENDLYIAMAGPHQIWKMTLDQKEIGPYAGNGREDIVDGPLLPQIPYTAPGFSSFAQPSGLTSDGTNLYVADSEGSSIRSVPFDPTKEVTTVVGTANLPQGRLFHFGDVDGIQPNAKLQHCLDVVFHDNLLYVADTYNNKIKIVDPKKRSSTTLVGTGKPGAIDGENATFDEPAGLAYAAGKLYVADTNGHKIRVVDLANKNLVSTLAIAGLEPPAPPKTESTSAFKDGKQVHVKAVSLKPEAGVVKFAVDLTLPEGYKINKLAPMKYQVEVTGVEGAIDRAGIGKASAVAEPATKFEISVPVKGTGDEKVKISLVYYYCKEGNEGLCKVGTVTWNVPVNVAANAANSSAALTYETK